MYCGMYGHGTKWGKGKNASAFQGWNQYGKMKGESVIH